MFWFQIEAEIAEHAAGKIAAASPALFVLFATTQASMFSAPLSGERSEPDLCSSALPAAGDARACLSGRC